MIDFAQFPDISWVGIWNRNYCALGLVFDDNTTNRNRKIDIGGFAVDCYGGDVAFQLWFDFE